MSSAMETRVVNGTAILRERSLSLMRKSKNGERTNVKQEKGKTHKEPESFLDLPMHPDLGTVGEGQRKARTARGDVAFGRGSSAERVWCVASRVA